MSFQKGSGDWKNYRQQFNLQPDDEVDLHFGRRSRWVRYDEVMSDVEDTVVAALRSAQAGDRSYVMFLHGWSTSRNGAMTARSVVRRIMRSKEATPFIERSGCVQHRSVFVAKIRQSIDSTTLIESTQPRSPLTAWLK
jgi:hypothetical protein